MKPPSIRVSMFCPDDPSTPFGMARKSNRKKAKTDSKAVHSLQRPRIKKLAEAASSCRPARVKPEQDTSDKENQPTVEQSPYRRRLFNQPDFLDLRPTVRHSIFRTPIHGREDEVTVPPCQDNLKMCKSIDEGGNEMAQDVDDSSDMFVDGAVMGSGDKAGRETIELGIDNKGISIQQETGVCIRTSDQSSLSINKNDGALGRVQQEKGMGFIRPTCRRPIRPGPNELDNEATANQFTRPTCRRSTGSSIDKSDKGARPRTKISYSSSVGKLDSIDAHGSDNGVRPRTKIADSSSVNELDGVRQLITSGFIRPTCRKPIRPNVDGSDDIRSRAKTSDPSSLNMLDGIEQPITSGFIRPTCRRPIRSNVDESYEGSLTKEYHASVSDKLSSIEESNFSGFVRPTCRRPIRPTVDPQQCSKDRFHTKIIPSNTESTTRKTVVADDHSTRDVSSSSADGSPIIGTRLPRSVSKSKPSPFPPKGLCEIMSSLELTPAVSSSVDSSGGIFRTETACAAGGTVIVQHDVEDSHGAEANSSSSACVDELWRTMVTTPTSATFRTASSGSDASLPYFTPARTTRKRAVNDTRVQLLEVTVVPNSDDGQVIPVNRRSDGSVVPMSPFDDGSRNQRVQEVDSGELTVTLPNTECDSNDQVRDWIRESPFVDTTEQLDDSADMRFPQEEYSLVDESDLLSVSQQAMADMGIDIERQATYSKLVEASRRQVEDVSGRGRPRSAVGKNTLIHHSMLFQHELDASNINLDISAIPIASSTRLRFSLADVDSSPVTEPTKDENSLASSGKSDSYVDDHTQSSKVTADSVIVLNRRPSKVSDSTDSDEDSVIGGVKKRPVRRLKLLDSSSELSEPMATPTAVLHISSLQSEPGSVTPGSKCNYDISSRVSPTSSHKIENLSVHGDNGCDRRRSLYSGPGDRDTSASSSLPSLKMVTPAACSTRIVISSPPHSPGSSHPQRKNLLSYSSDSHSESGDEVDKLKASFVTPRQPLARKADFSDGGDFINDDSSEDEQEDNDLSLYHRLRTDNIPSRKFRSDTFIRGSDSSLEAADYSSPNDPNHIPSPPPVRRIVVDRAPRTTPVRPHTRTLSFLSSLASNLSDGCQRHPDAVLFVAGFKRRKLELANHLFQMLNREAFQMQLPADLQITFNNRLLKTAGYCYNSMSVCADGATPFPMRKSRIELSTKVVDTAERLRDTLVHELCHAVSWLVTGCKSGHGRVWKDWAGQVCRRFPELPPVTRCHAYQIAYRFTYQCTQCGYRLGRHSRSLDTERKVCGRCRGRFQCIPTAQLGAGAEGEKSGARAATPRQPNPFAMFVKHNYGSVKKEQAAMKHAEIMKLLGQKFAETKISAKA